MLRKMLAFTLVMTPAAAQAEWFRVETTHFSMMGDFKSEADAKARGEKLVAEAVPVFEQACGELVDVLSERDRRDLQRILDKLWIHVKAPAASED